jgi:LmeA-like phospholipid-binding
MSDDPTRPVPSGWPQQPPRYRAPEGYTAPEGYGPREGYGPQEPYRRDDRGRHQDGWGQTGGQGDWGGQDDRDQGSGNGGGRTRTRRRHRGLKVTAIVVVVLLALLAIGDRVANGVAENVMANEIKSQGFPVKPKVTIEGFPFLTQLAARDFHQIDISASNVKEGPLEIASVNATMHGVHISSGFTGATVDQINGTALVTFAGISSAAGISDGISLSNGGHNELKASINLGFISGSALAQVTRKGPHQIEVKIVQAGGIPLSALGNASDFTISLPTLPAGMTIQNVSVTGQGVLISISGSHTTFSQ